MDNHYSIEYKKKGDRETWSVVMFMSEVISNIDNPDLANKIANELNEAYQEGRRHAEEKIRDRIISNLFS